MKKRKSTEEVFLEQIKLGKLVINDHDEIINVKTGYAFTRNRVSINVKSEISTIQGTKLKWMIKNRKIPPQNKEIRKTKEGIFKLSDKKSTNRSGMAPIRGCALNPGQVRSLRSRVANNVLTPLQELAAEYRVDKSVLSRALKGKNGYRDVITNVNKDIICKMDLRKVRIGGNVTSGNPPKFTNKEADDIRKQFIKSKCENFKEFLKDYDGNHVVIRKLIKGDSYNIGNENVRLASKKYEGMMPRNKRMDDGCSK